MFQEFQRDYLIRLPLPLAQLYQRAFNDKSAQSRHNNTFYLFEALIKLATAPVVAAYLLEVEQGGPRVAELDRLLVHLALPSLGQWVGMLRALAKHFGTRPDATAHPMGHLWDQLNRPHRDRPGMLGLYRRIKNGLDGEPAGDQSCTLMQVIDALVPYRNAVFGHGAGRFESFYGHEMGPLLFPAANEVLAEGMLDLLGPRGSRLVHLAELRVLDEERVEAGLRELVGEHSARTAPLVLSRTQAETLVPDRVVVLWPGRPVPLRLDPLLLYREREMGDEVLFLNRDRNGRQVEYLSYTRGEPERDRATAPALAALLGRVIGREVNVERLEAFAQQSVAETPSVEALFGPPPIPTRALGDYEILAEIGRGGMGVVYLARQLSLGRLVALKMLPADLAGDEVALARFRREMRLLARCDHPHIITVLASGTLPDGRVYYAMEYVPGCDLDQVWRELSGVSGQGDASSLGGSTWARAVLSASRKKRAQMTLRPTPSADAEPAPIEEPPPSLSLPPLPELPSANDDPGGYARRVAELVRDAALALQAIHDQQVVHRDVKPANLMLTPDGARVVLMDFGLAKGQSLSLTATKAGGLLGTLRYAAPEQLAAASLKVGPVADVRGLGVTLWELLTRRRLFAEAEDERQLAALVYDRDVPRLRTIDRSHDRDLEAIVARATERRAGDRIATAGQLAEYLQLYLDAKSLPIRPPTTAEMVGRWVRTHKALVWSTGITTCAIMISIAIAMISLARSASAEKAKTQAEGAKARAEHQQARAARRRSVELALDRGLALCDQGDIGQGLLWIAEALRGTAADDQLHRLVRTNLAGWSRLSHRLKEIHTPPGGSRPLVSNDDSFVGGRRSRKIPVNSPDRKTQLRVDDNICRLYRTDTNEPIGPPLVHRSDVMALAFSSDGSLIASGDYDGFVRIWEASNGKLFGAPMAHCGQIESIDFSDGDRSLKTFSRDGLIRTWEIARGDQKTIAQFWHDDEVTCVAFDSTSNLLLTGCKDGFARLRDAKTRALVGEYRLGRFGSKNLLGVQLRSKSDSERALKDTIFAWPPRVARVDHTQVMSVAFGPGGWILVGGGYPPSLPWLGCAQLFVARPGISVSPLAAPPLPFMTRVNSVAFNADGKSFITGGYDGWGWLWGATSQESIARLNEGEAPTPSPILAVALSPDGQMAATGSYDWLIRMYSLPEAGHSEGVNPKFLLSHQSRVNALAFSPDSRMILSGSGDRTARLWDVKSGANVGSPLRHPGEVLAVAFARDGMSVLTGSDDHIARFWDLRTGRMLAPLWHRGPVNAVAYSPDGNMVGTGSSDGTARLWKIPEPIGGKVDQVACWLEVISGMEIDSGGGVQVLDAKTWEERCNRLLKLGGTP